MRIVHTSLRYPPSSGGAETYARDIVEQTRHIDDSQATTKDVRVITSRLRTHGPISQLPPESLLDDPPYIQRLHHARTPLISYPRLQALSHYIGHHNPDVLHSYGFWYQPADTTARYAKHHNIPFIFHPIYYENEIRQKPQWQIYKKIIGQQTFAAADIVAVISPYEKESIENAGYAVNRFELIPPGLFLNEYQVKQPNIFKEKNIHQNNIFITVSRLAAGKGIEDAIKAIASIKNRFKDTALCIIGEDFGHQATLKNMVKQNNLESHVYFLGKLSRVDLLSAYQHAQALIHPSHYEAFGIVLAESLASGTPVIARNIAAIPFVAPHPKASLLFNTQSELEKNIQTLLENPALSKTLGHNGQKHVSQNFAWPTIIKKIESLYDELSQK